MDPLRLAIAVLPLAAYLFVIGLINLRRRPLVVVGANDAAALAVALGGLVVIGPLELFMPLVLAAAARFGVYVWVFLLAFYGLCATLAILVMRPRLVVYNTTIDVLRPILATVVGQLDANARWAGRCIAVPALGIELHLVASNLLQNVSLVATGSNQNLTGWQKLDEKLRDALGDAAVTRGARGVFFLACAAALVVAALSQMVFDPQAVALGMGQLLHP